MPSKSLGPGCSDHFLAHEEFARRLGIRDSDPCLGQRKWGGGGILSILANYPSPSIVNMVSVWNKPINRIKYETGVF